MNISNIFLPGLYCNHYFLQMLAQIGRGYYDAAYDAGEFISPFLYHHSNVVGDGMKIT